MLDDYKELPEMAKFDEREDTVYTTWKICYDQLKPESRELLWLIAYLHYDGIFEGIFTRAAQNMRSKTYALPLTDLESEAHNCVEQYLSKFLDSDGNWDTIKFARVTGDLRSYSLIEFDPKNLTYRMHVLVHDWAKVVVPRAPELAVECTSTLLSLSTDWKKDAESLAFKRRLGLHVTSLLNQHPNIGANQAAYLQHVYDSTGQWSQRDKLVRKIVEAYQQQLGDDDINTWWAKDLLATSYFLLDQFDEAAQLEEKIMNEYKQVCGEEHPDTLRVIGTLASYYTALGRLNEAEALQVQVLGSLKNIHGEEHRDTLVGKSKLAETYAKMGLYEKAESLHVQVLNISKRVMGEEHSDTLAFMCNLAFTYSHLGRWDEATELYHKAISVAERTLGDQHPYTQRHRENFITMERRRQDELVSRFYTMFTPN